MSEPTNMPPSGDPYSTSQPTSDRPAEGQWSETPPSGQAREWMSQLQSMIENLAEQAVPVVREIGAKAAELAAVAAEKAGPVAAKAAEVTADVGTRLAERSRNLATELRREADADATRQDGGAATSPSDANSASNAPAAGESDPSRPEG